MFPSKKALLLLAPALLLGGCGTVNRGLESVHQPVVERNDYVFDVATGADGLAPGEAGRLAGWLASLRLGYGDRIAVDDADDGRTGAAARDVVAGQAARYGLLLTDQAPVTVGTIAPGTARIVVSRMTASVPGCPDHSRTSGLDLNANTNSNFGCATNSNLAAMIARPEDLVRGQPGADTIDSATSFKAIDTMRKAPATGAGGLKSETTKGGR
jgi:pilus assembly protein CpaD